MNLWRMKSKYYENSVFVLPWKKSIIYMNKKINTKDKIKPDINALLKENCDMRFPTLHC
jgi:hypothetical protein